MLSEFDVAIGAEAQTHIFLALSEVVWVHSATCWVVVAIPQAIYLALGTIEGVEATGSLGDRFGTILVEILADLEAGGGEPTGTCCEELGSGRLTLARRHKIILLHYADSVF